MVSKPSYFYLMPENDFDEENVLFFIQGKELKSDRTALTPVFHFCLHYSFIDK